jgi:hypothetical protein
LTAYGYKHIIGTDEILRKPRSEKSVFCLIHAPNYFRGKEEATIFPENATNKSLTWTSDNEIVATVSSKGLVKALKEGSANIKVTTVNGRLTATCVVSVVERQELFGAVDLGLSVKWANMNIGADNSWKYGDYFAWGETSAKDNYNWSSYSLCDGTDKTMTKYCTLSEYGTVDNKTTLEPADDVARVKLGGNWRMPTEAEMDELVNTLRHKVVLPDWRGPVSVITGKYKKSSFMYEAIVLFINRLFTFWTNLKFNFIFG